MKTRVLTFLALSLILALPLSSCGTPGGLTEGQSPAPAATPAMAMPEETVDSFYTWYLDAARRQGSPLLGGNRAYRSSVYFTPEFVKQVDDMIAASVAGPVADPFVLAQDIPASFMADSATVDGDSATVIVHTRFAGNATPHDLRIELKQTGDQWKIAGIKEASTTSTEPAAKTPEAVVTEFYTWCIGYGKQTDGGNPLVDKAYQSSVLLTDDLKARVDQLVASGPVIADPFLLAQDVPESFTVDQAAITGDTATLVVHARFAGNSKDHDLAVELKQVGENWKISDVKPAKPE